jgi:hypothetical protein
MSDEVKNALQLRIGLINEILSQANIYPGRSTALEILPLGRSSAPLSRS